MIVCAIVLAGGGSSRFGSDKLAADLDGAPVLHHALRAAAAVADEIILVIGPGSPVPALPRALEPRVRVGRDTEPLGGPLAGLAAGLALVGDEPPRIAVVVGGDMPGLLPDVLALLAESLAVRKDLVAMTLAASQPAPLPLALRPGPARAATVALLAGGQRRLRALLEAVPAGTVPAGTWRPLDPEGATLVDIDTPGDLRARTGDRQVR